MSSVPPNLVGPILQSHLTQRQVSGVRDNEQAQKTNAERKQTAAVDEEDTTVDTGDEATQVHTDAEGSGSQGRAFANPDQNEEPDPQAQDTDLPPDAEEGRHIDLEA